MREYEIIFRLHEKTRYFRDCYLNDAAAVKHIQHDAGAHGASWFEIKCGGRTVLVG